MSRLRGALRHRRRGRAVLRRSTRSRSIRRCRIPGSLMSFRDPHAMLECLFYVNELPGGEAHHDGGMKGRDHAAVLANPMLQLTRRRTGRARSAAAAAEARSSSRRRGRRRDRRTWCCRRPMSPAIALPGTDKPVTRARRIGSGVRRGREEVSRRSASSCRAISIPRRKLGKAAALRAAPGTRSR